MPRLIEFDKINKGNFMVKHSQANVTYNVSGFKLKNQDKVIMEIEDMVNGLFEHKKRENFGKTLLNKFEKDIENLMGEL